MKKRIFASIFAVALIALSLVALAACGNDTELVYGKKYILEDDVNEKSGEQTYYVFEKDGTCTRHYYSKKTVYESYDTSKKATVIIDYIVQYRYTFVDGDKSTIVYFYNNVIDSSTYTDSNGKTVSLKDSEYYKDYYGGYDFDHLPKTDSNGLIMVSKNVLCIAGVGYTFYINEDYLNTIPNFNKVDEKDNEKEDEAEARLY